MTLLSTPLRENWCQNDRPVTSAQLQWLSHQTGNEPAASEQVRGHEGRSGLELFRLLNRIKNERPNYKYSQYSFVKIFVSRRVYHAMDLWIRISQMHKGNLKPSQNQCDQTIDLFLCQKKVKIHAYFFHSMNFWKTLGHAAEGRFIGWLAGWQCCQFSLLLWSWVSQLPGTWG